MMEKAPFLDEMSEHVRRIRRNMMIFSGATLLFTNGLPLDEFSAFGIQISQIPYDNFISLLVILVAYNFLYFLWLASDHITECWMRLTGNENYGKAGTIFDISLDPSKNKNNSTLYSEWERVFTIQAKETLNALIEFKDEVSRKSSVLKGLDIKADEVASMMAGYNNTLSNLSRKIEAYASDEILKKLNRFESIAARLVIGESCRFFAFELLIPLSFAIWAFVCGFASIQSVISKLYS